MNLVLEDRQKTLFNIDTKEINPYWIDPLQPLQIPVNPLHYEAHKLQLLLARLDRQAETNPAQFNSTNYINTLDRFTKLCEAINTGEKPDENILGSGKLGEVGNEIPTPEVGDGVAISMDSRISADNPLAG